jgi:hypothetical protein
MHVCDGTDRQDDTERADGEKHCPFWVSKDHPHWLRNLGGAGDDDQWNFFSLL